MFRIITNNLSRLIINKKIYFDITNIFRIRVRVFLSLNFIPQS